MIRILYFASLRDRVGIANESLEVAPGTPIEAIVRRLSERGGQWAEAFSGKTRVLAAINQEMANYQQPVSDGDELAFFPPVTGG